MPDLRLLGLRVSVYTRIARIALAGYFAGAVLMPYERFLEAATQERHDIELLGHRFRVSFEQVCHRLTCLQRPGASGVPLRNPFPHVPPDPTAISACTLFQPTPQGSSRIPR